MGGISKISSAVILHVKVIFIASAKPFTVIFTSGNSNDTHLTVPYGLVALVKRWSLTIGFHVLFPSSFTNLDSNSKDTIRLEQDIFAQQLTGSGQLFVFHTQHFWSQIKNAG